MASGLEELLAATFLKERERLEARNPFLAAAQAVQQVDIGKPKPSDAWKYTFLTNLASNLAQNIGAQQVESQYGDLASKFAKAYESPQVSEALSADESLKPFAGMAALIESERKQDLKSLIDKARLENPWLRVPSDIYGQVGQKAMPKPTPLVSDEIDADVQRQLASDLVSQEGGATLEELQATLPRQDFEALTKELSGASPQGGNFFNEYIKARQMGVPGGEASRYAQLATGLKSSQYPSLQPTTPEVQKRFGEALKVPENERQSRLGTMGALDKELSLGRMLGEQMRPISRMELAQLNANRNFQRRMGKLQGMIKDMGEGSILRALKGGKIFSFFAKTESPEYKFYAELDAAQQEYARGKDTGNLSTFDVTIWGPLFEGLPALDSKKALKERMRNIVDDMQFARKSMLDALKQGGTNIFEFETERQGLAQKELDRQMIEEAKSLLRKQMIAP